MSISPLVDVIISPGPLLGFKPSAPTDAGHRPPCSSTCGAALRIEVAHSSGRWIRSSGGSQQPVSPSQKPNRRPTDIRRALKDAKTFRRTPLGFPRGDRRSPSCWRRSSSSKAPGSLFMSAHSAVFSRERQPPERTVEVLGYPRIDCSRV